MVTSTNMSLEVLPTIRKKPRLEWRMASETARLAALVESLPWTSTPMPISVIQRTRAIGDSCFHLWMPICGLLPAIMKVSGAGAQSHSLPTAVERATRFPNRHCEPTSWLEAPPDDMLREAIHLLAA